MTTVSNLTTGDAVPAPALAPTPKSRLVSKDPNRVEFAQRLDRPLDRRQAD